MFRERKELTLLSELFVCFKVELDNSILSIYKCEVLKRIHTSIDTPFSY